MKRATRVFALLISLTTFSGVASAVSLTTNAVVTIVEGITIAETQQMNFGTLALNDGNVVLATDGTTTDTNALIFDNTGIVPATFDVDAPENASLDVTITPAAQTDGLVLTDPNVAWNGGASGASPQTFTAGAVVDVLTVGATLSQEGSTTGASKNVGYDVVIVFN